MSGGYFSCGSWMGGDKTGSAFFEVLADVEEVVITPDERAVWDADFSNPIRAQLNELDEGEPRFMRLSRRMLDVMVPPARRYFEILIERHGHPDPDTWDQIGEWKTGDGWKLMCLEELFHAYEANRRLDKHVLVHFD